MQSRLIRMLPRLIPRHSRLAFARPLTVVPLAYSPFQRFQLRWLMPVVTEPSMLARGATRHRGYYSGGPSFRVFDDEEKSSDDDEDDDTSNRNFRNTISFNRGVARAARDFKTWNEHNLASTKTLIYMIGKFLEEEFAEPPHSLIYIKKLVDGNTIGQNKLRKILWAARNAYIEKEFSEEVKNELWKVAEGKNIKLGKKEFSKWKKWHK